MVAHDTFLFRSFNHVPASVFTNVKEPYLWSDTLDTVSLKYTVVFSWLGILKNTILTVVVLYCGFKLYTQFIFMPMHHISASRPSGTSTWSTCVMFMGSMLKLMLNV